MRKIISGICLFGLFAAACMSDADKLTATQLMLLIPVFTAGLMANNMGRKRKKPLQCSNTIRAKAKDIQPSFRPDYN